MESHYESMDQETFIISTMIQKSKDDIPSKPRMFRKILKNDIQSSQANSFSTSQKLLPSHIFALRNFSLSASSLGPSISI